MSREFDRNKKFPAKRKFTNNANTEGRGNNRKRTERPRFKDSNEAESLPEILEESRLEGRNAIEEALKAGRTFNKVWYLKADDDKRMDRRLGELVHKTAQTGAVMYPIDRKALDRMAVTFSHQGIIAEVAAHEYVEVEDILKIAEERNEEPFIILLDQIQDSQNLGAIMRTADAVGAHGVVITKRRSVSLDAAAAKASAGAIEYVACARVTNLNQTLTDLKDRGLWIAGLAMDGDNIFESKQVTGPLALVIGSEGSGISQQVEKNCDYLLQIPMHGKINSLNASNAAAVAMYEILRKRAMV